MDVAIPLGGTSNHFLTARRRELDGWDASLARQIGTRAYLMFHLFFGAATVCLPINPLYWALTAIWFASHFVPIESVFLTPLLYMGCIGMFVGNAVFTLTAVSGSFERRYYDDVKWALLSPLYWLMMSAAAWKALVQLFHKPFYWEKTKHSFCLYGENANAETGANLEEAHASG